MLIKILIAGDGGQGVQTISDIICQAAFENGFFVNHIPNYGLEQRGGVSLSYITIGDKEITYPKFSMPDILAMLSKQADNRTKQYQKENVKMLNIEDYKKNLEKQSVKPQNYNIFFLGLLAKILIEKKICGEDCVLKLLEKKFGKKENWEEKKNVFELSLNYV
ncbi:MAG: 2-oxoacid:acceptor oxidoreductase family protein [Patescibacteria group bacterium]